MGDAVCDYFNSEALRLANCFIAGQAVAHDARQFASLGNPAAVVLTIQFDGQVHSSIIVSARAVLVPIAS